MAGAGAELVQIDEYQVQLIDSSVNLWYKLSTKSEEPKRWKANGHKSKNDYINKTGTVVESHQHH